MPLYNTLAYFGSGYLISELCPACLTGISGCFFSLVFLFACFSFFCSLWLAFQVLPGPCNLHRPGGIPRIALGKEGKKNSIDIAQALITYISTQEGDAQLAYKVAESQSTSHVDSTFRIMWREAESKEHRRRSLQNFVRIHHHHFLFLWTERRVHPFG